MKNIVIVILMTFIGLSAFSQEKKNKNAKYSVEVNGNCELCKKRIEKAAYSVSGVKSAQWRMDDHTLLLIINEEKSSLLDVEKAVAKVGHDTNDVKATDENYENLHACCMYDRK